MLCCYTEISKKDCDLLMYISYIIYCFLSHSPNRYYFQHQKISRASESKGAVACKYLAM